MDLLDDPQPGSNTPEFTVSEIAGSVKKLIEAELGWVRIKGEVGRVVQARSGHLYFDLKDDRAVLSCMTWKGQIPALGLIPEEGTEVVAEGKMTASGFQSKFALNAQRITIAGEGALMALLERRKKALAAEGLFDEARKKPLPYLPDIIGVVTSMQGVVIRDILHRLRDRFPRKVLVWPVAVQGAACAPEVARAIEGFNALTPGGALPRPDLLIVARGGGSVEDLWGFNEEIVARAAAASDIPLISAVGHETDTTLIDFASDKRAPTPTAAAELAVPVRHELMAWLEGQGARMQGSVSQGLSRRDQRLRDLARALPRVESLLDTPRQRLDRASDTLRRVGDLTSVPKQRLERAGDKLGPALTAGVQRRRVRLSDLSGGLRPASLRNNIERERRRLSKLAERLTQRPDALRRENTRQHERMQNALARLASAGGRQVQSWRKQIDGLERLRVTLGYEATLERGFAVVRSGGAVVTTAKAAKAAASLEIQFADGRIDVGSKPAARKKSDPSPEQGSLL